MKNQKPENFYKAHFEGLNLGQAIINSQFEIVCADKKFCSITGQLESNIVGKNLAIVLGETNFKKIIALKNFLSRDSASANVPSAPMHFSDKQSAFEPVLHIIQNGKDESSSCFYGLYLKNLEAAISAEALVLAAHLAKDLKSPLQAMQNLIELGLKASRSSEVTTILKSVETVLPILQDVVANEISYLYANSQTKNQNPVESAITEILSEVCALQNQSHQIAKASGSKAILRYELAKGSKESTSIDGAKLKHILFEMTEYIFNCGYNGEVLLSAFCQEKGCDLKIDIVCSSDILAGVDFQEIFKSPQLRGDDVLKNDKKNLGLAFYLLDQMGGTLEKIVTPSTSGFRLKINLVKENVLVLPDSAVAPKTKSLLAVKSIEPVKELSDKTVLIVDDEETLRQVLGMQIVKMGFKVLYADNGLEGLRLFDPKIVSLIVTDVAMPNLNGLQMLKAILKSTETVNAIVISGRHENKRSAEALGAQFVEKPYNIANLLQQIKGILTEEKDKAS